jgi:excisionase family DNA binding protein
MQLLGLADVGAYLGVSKRTVRRLVDQRVLPFYKVGRLLRFDLIDLKEYLKTCKVEKIT